MNDLQKIRAAIYDMDGLLINSEPYWVKKMQSVFESVGIKMTEEECSKTTGLRFDEVVDYWYGQYKWKGKTPLQFHDEVICEMEKVILHEAAIMPGVYSSINFFREKGYKIALASSSCMQLIRACVQRIGSECFDVVVSAENEKYGKPHPAVFLQAAQLLQCNPVECLVLEDSINGVIAAKAARMYCVAVPLPEMWINAKFSIADKKMKSLEEIETWIY